MDPRSAERGTRKSRSQSWCCSSLLNVAGVVAMISRIHLFVLGLIN